MLDAIDRIAAPCVLAVWTATTAMGQSQGDDILVELGLDAPTGPRVQVVAVQDAVFKSPAAGRIVALPFREGDAVRKGEVLLAYDCARPRAVLDRAVARAGRVETELRAATRRQRLGSESASAVAVRAAELREAQAEVVAAEVETTACDVVAPFDGRIADLRVRAHHSVAVGQDLFRLVNGAALELKAVIPAKWLTDLERGDAFAVRIEETARRYDARIERFGAQVEPVSQTIAVYGTLADARPGLLPGMSGQATFEVAD